MRILITAFLFCFFVGTAWAADSGRYVIHNPTDDPDNTYIVDKETGRIWRVDSDGRKAMPYQAEKTDEARGLLTPARADVPGK